jgi:hypothetical protein
VFLPPLVTAGHCTPAPVTQAQANSRYARYHTASFLCVAPAPAPSLLKIPNLSAYSPPVVHVNNILPPPNNISRLSLFFFSKSYISSRLLAPALRVFFTPLLHYLATRWKASTVPRKLVDTKAKSHTRSQFDPRYLAVHNRYDPLSSMQERFWSFENICTIRLEIELLCFLHLASFVARVACFAILQMVAPRFHLDTALTRSALTTRHYTCQPQREHDD